MLKYLHNLRTQKLQRLHMWLTLITSVDNLIKKHLYKSSTASKRWRKLQLKIRKMQKKRKKKKDLLKPSIENGNKCGKHSDI